MAQITDRHEYLYQGERYLVTLSTVFASNGAERWDLYMVDGATELDPEDGFSAALLSPDVDPIPGWRWLTRYHDSTGALSPAAVAELLIGIPAS